MGEITEYEVYTKEPESLTVGELNRVVRALREALYQQKLATQAARDAVARQAFAETCLDCSLGHSPVLVTFESDSGEPWSAWRHRDGCDTRCYANVLRLALDPDGRLAREVKS